MEAETPTHTVRSTPIADSPMPESAAQSTPPAPTRVLVSYASKHGATAEIAQAIADELAVHGLVVDCRLAEEVHDVVGYDAVVLGSAIYMKRWRSEARQLLHHHADALRTRPFWIFSSGPFGEHPDPEWSEPPKTIHEAESLGVRDHRVFGGRLPTEPGNFIERAMVKNTPAEVSDLRDWDEIRAWATQIAGELSTPAPASDRTGALRA